MNFLLKDFNLPKNEDLETSQCALNEYLKNYRKMKDAEYKFKIATVKLEIIKTIEELMADEEKLTIEKPKNAIERVKLDVLRELIMYYDEQLKKLEKMQEGVNND